VNLSSKSITVPKGDVLANCLALYRKSVKVCHNVFNVFVKAEIVDDIENNVPGERKQNRQRRNQQFMLELAPEGYNS
jgi:hypothetical protein